MERLNWNFKIKWQSTTFPKMLCSSAESADGVVVNTYWKKKKNNLNKKLKAHNNFLVDLFLFFCHVLSPVQLKRFIFTRKTNKTHTQKLGQHLLIYLPSKETIKKNVFKKSDGTAIYIYIFIYVHKVKADISNH